LIEKCYTNYKSFTNKKVISMNYKKLVKELRDKLIITQEELAVLHLHINLFLGTKNRMRRL